MMQIKLSKTDKYAALIFFVFALIYCSISLVNHYQFRTYALDLGMFNNALYNYSIFNNATFTLDAQGKTMPFLATHFSPITILYTPFFYIFGSYTLLIIQIIAVLLGGLGIYKYSKLKFEGNSSLPLIFIFHFFSIWGIYSALSFDFHNNVIGSMMVPWLIYFLEKRNLKLSIILLILIATAMETMPIWLVFILLGFMLKSKRSLYDYIKFEIPAAFLCLIYGIIIIFVVMPYLQGADSNHQLGRYSEYGDSVFQIIYSFIKEPQLLIKLLFVNTNPDSIYDSVKIETHLMILLSGGIFLFFKPSYLIMLIPILGQKFLSDDYGIWGINNQYSIEFVPILSLVVIDSLKEITTKWRIPIGIAVAIITLGANIQTIESRASKWYDSKNTKFYSKRHYTPEVDVRKVKKALKLVSNANSVSASSRLASHIVSVEKLYHFPYISNAEYIALTKKIGFWPLSKEAYFSKINELITNQSYVKIYEDDDLIILKRANLH